MWAEVRSCRACNTRVSPVLDLGRSPLANALPDPKDPQPPYFPLGLLRCNGCGLVQQGITVPTEDLFGQRYPYFASVSRILRQHAEKLAQAVADRVDAGSLIIEAGSNDGALLQALERQGLRALGVDPATEPSAAASRAGCNVVCASFSPELACDLQTRQGPAAAICMSNVLAHVPDPGAMLEAAGLLLAPDGWLVIESQYWLDLVAAGAFDMIYHEHHSHFSLTSLAWLAANKGFGVVSVEPLPTQGGSLRLWCQRGASHSAAVLATIASEAPSLATAAARLTTALQQFRGAVGHFLEDHRRSRLAGYGAAAKTVTLLAASERVWPLVWVADAAPSKIGRQLPVGRVPVVSPSMLQTERPDVVMLFAWNLKEEILPDLEGIEVWVPFPRFERIQ